MANCGKFCSCLKKVRAKGCKSGRCYNPYAVCTSSLGYQCRNCGKITNWNQASREEIAAYLREKHVNVNKNDTKQDLLRKLRRWKSRHS